MLTSLSNDCDRNMVSLIELRKQTINLTLSFVTDLVRVCTELYLTILHCAILHYITLCNGIYGHECTEFVVGLAEEALRVILPFFTAT
jgi:hypothetical protein